MPVEAVTATLTSRFLQSSMKVLSKWVLPLPAGPVRKTLWPLCKIFRASFWVTLLILFAVL